MSSDKEYCSYKTKGGDIMNKNFINIHEVLKAFYFREKGMLGKQEFAEKIFNLNQKYCIDMLKVLILFNYLEQKDNEIKITHEGMSVVEKYSIVCPNCNEIIYFNPFIKFSNCINCNTEIVVNIVIKNKQ